MDQTRKRLDGRRGSQGWLGLAVMLLVGGIRLQPAADSFSEAATGRVLTSSEAPSDAVLLAGVPMATSHGTNQVEEEGDPRPRPTPELAPPRSIWSSVILATLLVLVTVFWFWKGRPRG